MTLVHLRHQGPGQLRTVCGLWQVGGIADVWEAERVTCPDCRAILERWTMEADDVSNTSSEGEGEGEGEGVVRRGPTRTVRVEFQAEVPAGVSDATVEVTVRNALGDRPGLLGWEAGMVTVGPIAPAPDDGDGDGGVRAALEGDGPLPEGWREMPLAGGGPGSPGGQSESDAEAGR